MSLISTRVRGNDPSLPAVLPSLTSALTRRRALFGAMALGMTPAAAVPALAAPSADAEMLDLIAQHPAAVDRWHAAERTAHQVERAAIADRPERPEALEHRPGDLNGIGLGLTEVDEPMGEDDAPPRWYGAKAVAWLEGAKPLRRWSEPAQAMVPDPIAEARRAEILVAADAHCAACLVVDRRVGLVAAELAVESAYDALSGIEKRLNDLAPRTLAGLAAKAAWAAGSEDELVMEMMLHQVAAFSLAS